MSRRKNNSHKGNYGHVLVVAGSARYSGAAVLCAEAALRAGAGLITLGIPKSLNNAVIKIKAKEIMTLPLAETPDAAISVRAFKVIEGFARKVNVVAIGPGLSGNISARLLARKVISRVNKAMVIDADGINALADQADLLKTRRKQETVITPHPGEMSKLLNVPIREVERTRKKTAEEFARKYGVTVALKGHRTVVCSGEKTFINNSGNPGMATGGSGDVLTGMIAAFLAQGLDSFSAAKYAVFLHGLAGDLAAEEKTQISLIASDIIAKIPEAIKRCN